MSQIKRGSRVMYKGQPGTVINFVDRGSQDYIRGGHRSAWDYDWVYVQFDTPRPISEGARRKRNNPFKVTSLTLIEDTPQDRTTGADREGAE